MEINVDIRATRIIDKMQQENMSNELPEHLICLHAEWNEIMENLRRTWR